MMSSVRTTLTLDDDVAHQLTERQRLTGMSYKELVNATLRAGLQSAQQPAAAPPPFRVMPKAAGFRAGVDVLRLNQLNDELESEGFLRDLAKSAPKRTAKR
jgi:hypothetical protein